MGADNIEEVAGAVGVRRLRYESPLEIALFVPAALLASRHALAVLIFSLKRMYGIDLEFRTHRQQQRAAFYEAKKQATEAELAWLAEQDPESWPPGLLQSVIATIDGSTTPVRKPQRLRRSRRQAPPSVPPAAFNAEEIVLIEEEDADTTA
jgi:hypothetical protein